MALAVEPCQDGNIAALRQSRRVFSIMEEQILVKVSFILVDRQWHDFFIRVYENIRVRVKKF